MAKTYTVSNHIPQAGDWALTQWDLTLADTQKVKAGSSVVVESDLTVKILEPTSSSAPRALIWTSEEPATLSDSGQLNGSGPYDDGTGSELITIVFSMVQLTVDDPDGPIVERHITMLTLEGDPEDVGVMGGSEGGG